MQGYFSLLLILKLDEEIISTQRDESVKCEVENFDP